MLSFIIFGTRGVTFNKGNGVFFCPQCGPQSDYRHKSVRRFFTLYFIPIIPLDSLGEYIECQRCQGTYEMGILDFDPAADAQRDEAAFMVAAKQAMIVMLLADGGVHENEVMATQTVFRELSGVEVPLNELREEIDVVQQEGSNSLQLLGDFADRLKDDSKEQVIQSAYRVGVADGPLDDREQKFLKRLADAMGLSAAHFAGILSEAQKQFPA